MATIGLISCVSKKHSHATLARNLYKSPLFKKTRDYVDKNCDSWYILSAKYGLVEPDNVIEPYDETLNTKSRMERKQWAKKVWDVLNLHLHPGDQVILLAGEKYREFLVPHLINYECIIKIPLEGLGIGKQLQWLSRQLSQRKRDLDRLYDALVTLENGLGGKRLLSECVGKKEWPKSGVYFFFEPGESRLDGSQLRVVRVGTHGVSRGSKATLWNRLRTHRGTGSGLGNHRSSIFRLHLGAALANRDSSLYVASWGIGQSADSTVRKGEEKLEQVVSKHIGEMSILWLAIDDEAGPASDRAYLEKNLIGLFVGKDGSIDGPSKDWLGRNSPDVRIRESGLWNLNYLDYSYSDEFLDVFEEYISITLGKKPTTKRSLAPSNWYLNERQGVLSNQLTLFEGDDCD